MTGYSWHKLPAESVKAYSAFQAFLELDSAVRSVAGAFAYAMRLPVKDEKGKVVTPPGLWRKWYNQFDWEGRAVGYDDHINAKLFISKEEAVANTAELWAERRNQQRDKELEMRDMLIARVTEMMKMPLVEQTISKDGKTIIIKPVKWNQGDLVRLAATVSKLGRLSAEMETDRSTVDVELSLAASIDQILDVLQSALPVEYYRKAVEALQKHMASPTNPIATMPNGYEL